MAQPSGSDSSEHEADNWVQCDKCANWRRVQTAYAETLDDDTPWSAKGLASVCGDLLTLTSPRRYCNFNPDKRFASCDIPQELPTHEIDNIDEEDDDNTDVRTLAVSPSDDNAICVLRGFLDTGRTREGAAGTPQLPCGVAACVCQRRQPQATQGAGRGRHHDMPVQPHVAGG